MAGINGEDFFDLNGARPPVRSVNKKSRVISEAAFYLRLNSLA